MKPPPDASANETIHHSPDLELEILRRSIGEMAAEREGCAACGRTPLIGEHMAGFVDHAGESWLCETCACSPVAAAYGESRERRRVGPRAGTVTVLRRAA